MAASSISIRPQSLIWIVVQILIRLRNRRRRLFFTAFSGDQKQFNQSPDRIKNNARNYLISYSRALYQTRTPNYFSYLPDRLFAAIFARRILEPAVKWVNWQVHNELAFLPATTRILLSACSYLPIGIGRAADPSICLETACHQMARTRIDALPFSHFPLKRCRRIANGHFHICAIFSLSGKKQEYGYSLSGWHLWPQQVNDLILSITLI